MSNILLRRRELLQGLGAASLLGRALFRDSLVEAAEATYPRRFVVFHVPGGAYLGLDGSDNHFTFAKMLSPLAQLQPEALMFTRMPNKAGDRLYAQTNEGHGAGNRTLLTGDSSALSGIKQTAQSPFAPSSSVDQIIANVVGKGSMFSSLQFGVFADHTKDAPLDHRRISLAGGLPLPPISDPAAMFKRLFPGAPAPVGQAALPPEPRIASAERRRSMLDHLKAEVQALGGVAGAAEAKKLEQHLTSLRELEKLLPPLPAGPGSPVVRSPAAACAPPDMKSVSADIPEVFRLQLDLLYQAMVCDATRVATFQILQTGNQTLQFPWLGISDIHHALQHEQRSKTTPIGERLDKVQTWFIAQLAGFVARLQATKEGGGSMLDNTLILICSELTGGDYHSHSPMLALTVGRAGGAVRPGRTIDCNGAAHNNLLIALAGAMGVNQPIIGDRDLCAVPITLG